MKNIKTFEEYEVNESWRQVKLWLRIPQILMEMLLQKLIKFVPRLGIMYDEAAAKIDSNRGISPSILKQEPIKLTLDDIKNDKMRRTLKATGIFDKWNVYTFDRLHDDRVPVYITKDELKLGDKYYGDRVSDWNIDKNYGKGERKYLKSKNVSSIKELEPQFYVICAVHSKEHDEMQKERDEMRKKKGTRSLEKEVNKAIKNHDYLGSTKFGVGDYNLNVPMYSPIFFKVVASDRLDLVKKITSACNDDAEMLKKIMNQQTEDYKGKKPIDFAISDEMRDYLSFYQGGIFDQK